MPTAKQFAAQPLPADSADVPAFPAVARMTAGGEFDFRGLAGQITEKLFFAADLSPGIIKKIN